VTPRTWTIGLVYDTLPLSLNDRAHHMIVWRKRKNLKERVRAAVQTLQIPRLDAIHVRMEWTPRTKRVRDQDNAVATLKPAIDGLRDYPARWGRGELKGQIVEQPHVGIVPDDDPTHVTWEQPVIHPPNPDPFFTERLVLVITERPTQ
jgi:hypothetical protein